MNFFKTLDRNVWFAVSCVLFVMIAATVIHYVLGFGVVSTCALVTLFADALVFGALAAFKRQEASGNLEILEDDGEKPYIFVVTSRLLKLWGMRVALFLIAPSALTLIAFGVARISRWAYAELSATWLLLLAAPALSGIGFGIYCLFGYSDRKRRERETEQADESRKESDQSLLTQAKDRKKQAMETFGFEESMFGTDFGLLEGVRSFTLQFVNSKLDDIAMQVLAAEETFNAYRDSKTYENAKPDFGSFNAFSKAKESYSEAQNLAYNLGFNITRLDWRGRVEARTKVQELEVNDTIAVAQPEEKVQ